MRTVTGIRVFVHSVTTLSVRNKSSKRAEHARVSLAKVDFTSVRKVRLFQLIDHTKSLFLVFTDTYNSPQPATNSFPFFPMAP